MPLVILGVGILLSSIQGRSATAESQRVHLFLMQILEETALDQQSMTHSLDASDSTRDQIYLAAKDTDTIIKLEAPSSGLGWLVLVNALPLYTLPLVLAVPVIAKLALATVLVAGT